MAFTPDASEADAVRPVRQRTEALAVASDAASVQVNATSVQVNTGGNQQDERETEISSGSYKPAERAAIDDANEVFGPVIEADVEAADRLEDIERWAPSLVRGVRAIRDRAMREVGARNRFSNEYRKQFRALLIAEPIGPWLLDPNHRADLDAVNYLGDDDNLDKFIDWCATTMTDKDRRKWRKLRTRVMHFKIWRTGAVGKSDRRTPDQKEIEKVRAEGHKAEAALLGEIEQARRELATHAIETTDTLWAILARAGSDMVFQSLKDHDAEDFGRALYKKLGAWLPAL
jgi:hypothetical protein